MPQRDFAWLGALLWNAAGRPAIGVTADHGRIEILLSPVSFQPTGLIERNPATLVIKPSPGASLSSQSALASPVPQVTETIAPQTTSIAVIQTAEVSQPGEK